jgi:hypothetical protein
MNMMKYCPECYKELPPNTAVCPFCGFKTGNGDQDEVRPPGFLKTPKTDSYLPPEQTILSLLLLVILFWGVNISVAVLPIYLNAGSLRNILFAAISSQVLTRVFLGIWAMEEKSLKKDVTVNQKIGAFFLALVPVGAIMSFLQAARTSIRKDRLSNLSIATISAVIIMSILLYGTKEGISTLSTGEKIQADPEATLAPAVSALYEDQEDPTDIPSTATPQPYINGCRNPLSIVPDEEGQVTELCGRITNFGVIDCDSCPSGFYSYVKLDSAFQIVSYEWRFTYVWLDKCVRVTDDVEILGNIPIFVYNKMEGCSAADCITDNQGGLLDDSGVYFQPFDGCE